MLVRILSKRAVCLVLAMASGACAHSIGRNAALASASRQREEPYDVSRDPAGDLHAALVDAADSHRRVLLVIGGMWCGWCRALERFIEGNEEIRLQIERHFVLVRVHYSRENENERFLAQYPPIPGCPHFYILESDGLLIHSQNTSELEEGDSYSQNLFRRFLDVWSSP